MLEKTEYWIMLLIVFQEKLLNIANHELILSSLYQALIQKYIGNSKYTDSLL